MLDLFAPFLLFLEVSKEQSGYAALTVAQAVRTGSETVSSSAASQSR